MWADVAGEHPSPLITSDSSARHHHGIYLVDYGSCEQRLGTSQRIQCFQTDSQTFGRADAHDTLNAKAMHACDADTMSALRCLTDGL